MRLLDARVYHPHQNAGVLLKLYHQLLDGLHLSETVLVHHVRVMEKQIVL